MTDDFTLFPNAGSTDASASDDADIGLITAYLARELSPVQIVALQDRLLTDVEFRDRVQPVMEGWSIPGAFRDTETFMRRSPSVAGVAAVSRHRGVRRAAVIALAIVLPAIGIAQVVRTMLRNASEPAVVVPPVTALHPLGGDARGAVPLADLPGQPSGQMPAVRALGPVIAQSTEPFDSVTRLVSFSDGRILLSDIRNKRIKAFDARLANARMVLDANTVLRHWYSPNSLLLPFRGDSALFLDQDGALAVMDARGAFGRDVAVPDFGSLEAPLGILANTVGPIHVSPAFGMVVRTRTSLAKALRARANDTLRFEDTVAVIASRFDVRKVDTLAFISAGSVTHATVTDRILGLRAFYPWYDEVVVSTDGSVAIFHARDFRVEWIGSDGTRTMGPNLTYTWRTLAIADRQRLVDSVNAQQRKDQETRRDLSAALTAIDSDFVRLIQGLRSRVMTGDPPVTGDPRPARVLPVSPRPPPPPPIPWTVAELPSVAPPTDRSAVLADGDNNVWIRPIAEPGAPPGEVWWVVNRKGQLIDRVRIPEGRRVVGFGTGGIVFLLRPGPGGSVLEKARVR